VKDLISVHTFRNQWCKLALYLLCFSSPNRVQFWQCLNCWGLEGWTPNGYFNIRFASQFWFNPRLIFHNSDTVFWVPVD